MYRLFKHVSTVMMSRATFAIVLVGSILVVPLLCTAGVTEHDCICVPTQCCAEEASCEPDPCDVVYAKECRREKDHDATTVIMPPLAGVAALATGEGIPAASGRDTCCNLPFPYSDLPLRI